MMGKCCVCSRWFTVKNHASYNNPFKACSEACLKVRKVQRQRERRLLARTPRMAQAALLEVKRVPRKQRVALKEEQRQKALAEARQAIAQAKANHHSKRQAKLAKKLRKQKGKLCRK